MNDVWNLMLVGCESEERSPMLSSVNKGEEAIAA